MADYEVSICEDGEIVESSTFLDAFGTEHRILGFFTGNGFRHYVFTEGATDPDEMFRDLKFVWQWEYRYDPGFAGIVLFTAEPLLHPSGTSATVGDLIARAFLEQGRSVRCLIA